ncbi:uncharacterized protein LOC122857495 isoform X2 [Aphidius gifuensis]|nr:uncharacterized protein LOC122857495 isoform X2 [Aphidius gifuensis]
MTNKPDEAYCKWCKKTLRPHAATLKRHGISQAHVERGPSFMSRTQKTLASFGIGRGTDQGKINICLVLHAAVHGTINSLDHLNAILIECGEGTPLEKLQLHSTKALKLIENVIAPGFLKELIDDIGEQDFSIILDDQSTDDSTNKFMTYCIRYFSIKNKKILTNYLGFSQVTETTAVELYDVFCKFLEDIGLKIENLIGISTDGAENLCGNSHSLYTLLKKKVSSLQLIKYTYHSIDKCAGYAIDELPSNLMFMLRETNNWFAHSGLRLAMYESYYANRHDGNKPKKLVSLSTTQQIYSANAIILNQYETLGGFFNHVHEQPDYKKCYTAMLLADMYNDHLNHLYLTFLDESLEDLHSINLAFQKHNADITKLYADLCMLLVSNARRVFKPSFLRRFSNLSESNLTVLDQADLDAIERAIEKSKEEFGCSLLPLDSMDFGRKFEKLVEEKQLVLPNKYFISTDNLITLKKRASAFIIRLCKEIKNRLPQNLSVIEKIKYFSPIICLSQSHIPVTDLPWELAGGNINEGDIESQWRHLRTLRFDDISSDIDESTEVIDFWIAVWEMKTANGERTFKDIAKFALRALSLPINNAEVERVFSIMAAVKTKIRNRKQMLLLVALIRIKMHIIVNQVCCMSYKPTKDMLDRFNKNMYQTNSTTPEIESHEDVLEVFKMFDRALQHIKYQ